MVCGVALDSPGSYRGGYEVNGTCRSSEALGARMFHIVFAVQVLGCEAARWAHNMGFLVELRSILERCTLPFKSGTW
jgi:hypothetical protein